MKFPILIFSLGRSGAAVNPISVFKARRQYDITWKLQLTLNLTFNFDPPF